MKIYPISNTQPKFQARFTKNELNTLVSNCNKEGSSIPELYTMLEMLDKMPERKASIVGRSKKGYIPFEECSKYDIKALTLDNKIIQMEATTPYYVLYLGVTSFQNEDGRNWQIPKQVFLNKVLQNENKNINDIEKLALAE